ncbi:MAG: hypothetical protein COW03_13270 [Cytophagales bacterium CG12_big_fil_rev_8_21_14_0_65_40_12]|nr:MAG: hypothetical protein COW03_13270 [Cytophagales bacterium CG12_big_fil_rev_8_21_14_0_65_40_12]PIW03107.1 MAG: hypothetical protein COW40_17345 [Cytophagales bacterium CG17_big_fil_post_rev_8_21_14_2_50_40_13]
MTESQIAEYLTNNLTSTSESDTQWFVENEDTETYFSFDQNEPETDEESIELFENFTDFDNTHFTFNLNYLRPDFFGQFAFEFVDKFIKDLDLFVLNPQSTTDPDNPLKPKENELYENWSETNSRNSANFFKEYGLEFYPLEKSNDFYNYNRNKSLLQEKLGDNYYVPKLYLFKRKSDGQIVTICTWTEHIPKVFPPADYYLLTKKYKKLFRTVEEAGLISSDTFKNRFGSFLDNFEFKNCKIIHPDKAEKVKDIFNSTKIEFKLADFFERMQFEKLVNVKPNE